MVYLISQIVLCMLVTALISFNIGWLLRGLKERGQNTFHNTSEKLEASVTNSSSALIKKEVSEPKTRAPIISHKIEKIPGIGKGIRSSLRKIEVKTTTDLINKCLSEKGFQQILSTIQVTDKTVTLWVSMADLMRVPDVDGQCAELMEILEIKSVHELAKANADELILKMKAIKRGKDKIPLPDIHRISNWIRDAKSLVNKG